MEKFYKCRWCGVRVKKSPFLVLEKTGCEHEFIEGLETTVNNTFNREELNILHWWGCLVRRTKIVEFTNEEKDLHGKLGKLI